MEASRPRTFEVLEQRNDVCEKHGPFTSKLLRFKGQDVPWSSCPICEEAARAEAQTLREREALLIRLEERAGIPPRFERASFATYKAVTDNQKRVLEVCQDYADRWADGVYSNGQCLILAGKPGTGKTHLALSIGRAILQRGLTVRYSSALRLIREVRSTWDGQGSEDDAIRLIASIKLLIMDEVGVQYGTDAEAVMLFEILNSRYEEMKPTVVVTNQSVEGLKTYLGERVFDRLREGGGKLVVFDWESHRKGN